MGIPPMVCARCERKMKYLGVWPVEFEDGSFGNADRFYCEECHKHKCVRLKEDSDAA